MEVGGRQVNAAAIHIGVVAAQAERLRADDAAVDDEGLPEVEVGITPHPGPLPFGRGEGGVTGAVFSVGNVFELFEDGELVSAKHGFGAVVAADFAGVLRVGG